MRTCAAAALARSRGLPRAFAFWVLLAPSSALAQPDPAPLFGPEAGMPTPAADGAAGATAARTHRTLRANRALLHAAREQVLSAGAGKLRLNLFDDADFVATLERSAPTASGYTLSGPLDGVPFGRAVLVVNDGVTMGRVYTPAGNYSIRGTERHQSVERMPASPPGCAADSPTCPAARQGSVPHPHPHAEPPGPLGAGTEARPTGPLDPVRPEAAGDHALERQDKPVASAAPGSAAAEEDGVVDVLVVYPSFVRDLEGGYGAMLAIIDLDFATANEAYAASGIELRVRVAAAVEVEYGKFLESAMVPAIARVTKWEEAPG